MAFEYTAKYRPPGKIMWRRIRRVVGDGFVEDRPIRFLELAGGEMMYFPETVELVFSRERAGAIRQQLSREAGQQIQVI